MAEGIKDKVAIIGMGCTKFGERWDAGYSDLIVEAFKECLEDAGIEKKIFKLPGWGLALTSSFAAKVHFLCHIP